MLKDFFNYLRLVKKADDAHLSLALETDLLMMRKRKNPAREAPRETSTVLKGNSDIVKPFRR